MKLHVHSCSAVPFVVPKFVTSRHLPDWIPTIALVAAVGLLYLRPRQAFVRAATPRPSALPVTTVRTTVEQVRFLAAELGGRHRAAGRVPA